VARLNQALERHVRQPAGSFEIVPVGIAVAHDRECRTITSNPAAAGPRHRTPAEHLSLS
jgi:hypothetical protein